LGLNHRLAGVLVPAIGFEEALVVRQSTDSDQGRLGTPRRRPSAKLELLCVKVLAIAKAALGQIVRRARPLFALLLLVAHP
jgi:hypothetical protein